MLWTLIFKPILIWELAIRDGDNVAGASGTSLCIISGREKADSGLR